MFLSGLALTIVVARNALLVFLFPSLLLVSLRRHHHHRCIAISQLSFSFKLIRNSRFCVAS